MNDKVLVNIIATVIAGFILALLIGECRETRQTRDAVKRLEEKIK